MININDIRINNKSTATKDGKYIKVKCYDLIFRFISFYKSYNTNQFVLSRTYKVDELI